MKSVEIVAFDVPFDFVDDLQLNDFVDFHEKHLLVVDFDVVQ